MKHKVKHLHFVGMGGSGMNGIAQVLLNLGYVVSGSDLFKNSAIERLEKLGATVYIGHDPTHIKGADVIVVSGAVSEDNPEVLAAREAFIPVVPRAVMLAELMRLKRGIAVAGTHGKTTTTSLVASILAQGGLDPTFVIGGVLNSAQSNAKLGEGDFIVVEADESDASFLNLSPVISIVTNIDADHMETYGHDFTQLKEAFIQFINHLPFYGVAVLCIDDKNIVDMLPFISKSVVTYGLDEAAAVRAIEVHAVAEKMHFTVTQSGYAPLHVSLNQPGTHNVQNACAAIAVARELGVTDVSIQEALASFKGVGRRFTRYGEIALPGGGTFALIDDYGHHPVEMSVTLSAARGAYPSRRLVLVFQPHRYTRTRDLFEDFVQAMSHADVLLLTEVYPAGEAPIVAADGRSLSRAIRLFGKVDPVFVENVVDVSPTLRGMIQPGDVVITMGAGAISGVPAQLIHDMEELGHKSML